MATKKETTDLATTTPETTALQLDCWAEHKDLIKTMLAKGTTDAQFDLFVAVAKRMGADPLRREIFVTLYNGDMTIVTARDLYLRKAQEQPLYGGYMSDIICENDTFSKETEIVDGVPKDVIRHVRAAKDRGAVIGSWCMVFYKDKSIAPVFKHVEDTGYNKGTATWKSIPRTMWKKVAEAQALRSAFAGVLAGTIDESEATLFNPNAKMADAQVISTTAEGLPVDASLETTTKPAPSEEKPGKKTKLTVVKPEKPAEPPAQPEPDKAPEQPDTRASVLPEAMTKKAPMKPIAPEAWKSMTDAEKLKVFHDWANHIGVPPATLTSLKTQHKVVPKVVEAIKLNAEAYPDYCEAPWVNVFKN